LGRLQRSLLLSHCETAWIGCYLLSKNLKGHSFTVEPLNDATRQKVQDNESDSPLEGEVG